MKTHIPINEILDLLTNYPRRKTDNFLFFIFIEEGRKTATKQQSKFKIEAQLSNMDILERITSGECEIAYSINK